METLLDFARGPLFRLTFIIMILGLLRVLILDIYGAVEAYRRAGDKRLDWKNAIIKTLRWIFPFKSAFAQRPFYSALSILFHIGLILTPLFLLAHIQLWEDGIGISWWSLPHFWADFLTILTIIAGLGLITGRLASRGARALSRKQDYFWLFILLIPFITGYICANTAISPSAYQAFMLIHILAGELIFVLIPFSKIAHCVLMPISQFIITLAWKFPARVDDKIAETLKKKGMPV
ncbi:MAG: hypothetical protein GF307_09880 [candidate division Zixibacteria bacterium]|nr:hypothetical protein [candidate division Zixibacteria bacterium]